MFHSDFVIEQDALFVTDAHYNVKKGQTAFLDFLHALDEGKIAASQLVLLGDIFDMLFGGVPHTAKMNEELVELLTSIAEKMEIFYFEGNHDFRLKKFFGSKLHIFPIKRQPALFHCNNKRLCLAHGDFDAPFGYKVYTALIRNPFILFFLNIYDSLSNHSVLRFVERHMSKKEECKKLEWFESFIQKRFEKGCACDYFVEGHFHQNKVLELLDCRYINLGAFACNQRYFVVKFKEDQIVFEERYFTKG